MMKFFDLCVECQAAAIGVLLRFLGLCILAFEIGEGHVQKMNAPTGFEPSGNFGGQSGPPFCDHSVASADVRLSLGADVIWKIKKVLL